MGLKPPNGYISIPQYVELLQNTFPEKTSIEILELCISHLKSL